MMKTKAHSFCFALTLTLLIGSCSYSEDSTESIQKLENKYSLIKNHLFIQYQNESIPIDSTIMVRNSNYEKLELSQVIGNQPKLIFRLSERHCSTCLNQEIQIIKSIIDQTQSQDIVILASFGAFESFKAFSRIKGLNNFMYLVQEDKLNAPIESLNIPYVFVLGNKSYQMNMTFVPMEGYPEISKEYYSIVFSRVFGQNIS